MASYLCLCNASEIKLSIYYLGLLVLFSREKSDTDLAYLKNFIRFTGIILCRDQDPRLEVRRL